MDLTEFSLQPGFGCVFIDFLFKRDETYKHKLELNYHYSW